MQSFVGSFMDIAVGGGGTMPQREGTPGCWRGEHAWG